VNRGKIDLTNVKRVDPADVPWSRKPELRAGDIIVVRSGAYTGDSALVPEELAGAIAGFDMVLSVSNAEPEYISYCLLSKHVLEGQIHLARLRAAQPHLNAEELGDCVVLLPARPEQRAIASFLDRETARIDALIARKQRQIELLREKRASLISHAVTGKMMNDECGMLSSESGSTHHSSFRTHHSMRPSGIDWLGDVPEHWTITRLGRIARNLQTGPFGSQLHAKDYVDDGVPVINPANIQDGEIVPNPKCAVGDEKCSELSRHVLREGDIVFARRGAMGRCALVTSDAAGCLCGTGSIRIRLNSSLACPRYVASLLGTPGVRDHLQLESVGSTMDNLNTGILSRIPCAVPPVPEQLSISSRIECETTRINRITSTVVQSIDLLREYRTSLISAAVTGKIDVRQQAE
jgi:type I restriction enzyme S subunit